MRPYFYQRCHRCRTKRRHFRLWHIETHGFKAIVATSCSQGHIFYHEDEMFVFNQILKDLYEPVISEWLNQRNFLMDYIAR